MSTYPLRGILFFLRDQHLWRLTIYPLLLTAAVALGVSITLFTFTLHWQEDKLYGIGLSSFFAWLVAVIFVLIEVFIVTIIYGLVTLEWFKDKIFAHVLTQCGHRELVDNEERLALSSRHDVVLSSQCAPSSGAIGDHFAAQHDPRAGQPHVRVAQWHALGLGSSFVLL